MCLSHMMKNYTQIQTHLTSSKHDNYIATQTPLDYILYGVLDNGQCVGLRHIPGYKTRVIEVKTRDYGLPQTRTRLYFVMSRTSDEAELDMVVHLVTVHFRKCHSMVSFHTLDDIVEASMPSVVLPMREGGSWQDSLAKFVF